MRRRRKKRFYRRMQLYMRVGVLLLFLLMIVFAGMKLFGDEPFTQKYVERTGEEIDALRQEMEVALLTENPYSRPGDSFSKIRGIVIHYTANPGSTAMQNRNYF